MNINVTMFAQMVTFGAFAFFCYKFVWPPLVKAIEARQKQIADGLAAGERGKQDLEQASRRSDEMLREVKAQVQEILAQAEKRSAQIVEEAKTSAKSEGERLIAAAKTEIAQEVSRARETLRTQVASLAVAGAEQILKREVDTKTHAGLLADLEKQL